MVQMYMIYIIQQSTIYAFSGKNIKINGIQSCSSGLLQLEQNKRMVLSTSILLHKKQVVQRNMNS